MEQWKTIRAAPDYAVSDRGRVKRITQGGPNAQTGSIRKQSNCRGYLHVILWIPTGRRKTFQTHRLVLSTFVGESEKQANHKNGNRSDNRLENLEYLTPGENQRHSRDVLGTFIMGSRHHQAKLTENDVREIFALRKQGMKGTVLAKRFHMSLNHMYRILRREWWKHVKIA